MQHFSGKEKPYPLMIEGAGGADVPWALFYLFRYNFSGHIVFLGLEVWIIVITSCFQPLEITADFHKEIIFILCCCAKICFRRPIKYIRFVLVNVCGLSL